MSTALLAVGIVLAAEGLLLALAPGRIEDLLRFFTSVSHETRRGLGLGALAFGVLLIWLAGG